ncbi:MAG: hypothetical protein N2651_08380, partial [Fimbriimonadales bacterium]|nr:hypothetical protein [Fimbriimonadales bacterium]
MRRVYRLGLIAGVGGLLLLCLWSVLSRTGSVEKEALDFDVAPSVEQLLFSTKSESHKGDRLFAFEKRTKLSRELK